MLQQNFKFVLFDVNNFQIFKINITDRNIPFFNDRCINYDNVTLNITGNDIYYTMIQRKINSGTKLINILQLYKVIPMVSHKTAKFNSLKFGGPPIY